MERKSGKRLQFCLLVAEINVLIECMSALYEIEQRLDNVAMLKLSQKLDDRLNRLNHLTK